MTVLDRALVEALLFDWLEAEALAPPGQSAADWRAFLDLCERLARERFLPAWKASDREEPRLEGGRVLLEPGTREAVRAALAAGLPLATVPEARGGMGLPFAVSQAGTAFLMAAHVAAAAFGMLSAANARLIRDHGTPAQAARFAAPQEKGRALGTMALSEPQAGSSLGDILTRAEPDGEDALGARFRLRGRKMWISAADHDATDGIVHLVLAKIPGEDGRLPEGTRGISLFIVPSRVGDAPNDLAVAGLNRKMGWRGTPNCALSLGEREGALGWLLGAPGEGLPIMFGMMNEARIGVGLGAAAQAVRGSLLARAYARGRLQGRPPGARGGPMVPLIRHPDVRRMLLTQRALAEGALALCLWCARLVDRGDARARQLLDLLTPVAKTFPSEMGLESLSLGLQVHGGYGYTRDFDLDQLWRDSRLNPIHEGTTGIQGLDLAGRKRPSRRCASPGARSR